MGSVRNGRYERMHLTLKKEATRPPGMNSLQQQARFDDFVQEFNTQRPHEALAMKCPAEIYSASSRPYSGLPDLTYPHGRRSRSAKHPRQFRIIKWSFPKLRELTIGKPPSLGRNSPSSVRW
jgi:hypothetical protein